MKCFGHQFQKTEPEKQSLLLILLLNQLVEGTIGLIIYIIVALEFLNDDQIFY